MSYVFERLYVGDFDDACNSSDLRDKKGVTHILTVDCKPLVREATAGFVYKFIKALDVEDFDLLSQFDDCIKFIDDGRKVGEVLVHCFAGQSRSATIAVAYLMARQDLTVLEALQLIKKMRPCVGPNPGFMKQLELFETMGKFVNYDFLQFRQYRMNMIATQMQNCNFQQESLAPYLSADPLSSKSSIAVYKCRKCRRSLFRESGTIPHLAGYGHSSFKKHSKRKLTPQATSQEAGTPCSASVFIEPVEWMQSMILRLDGKLSCPNCQAKIGSFRWAGDQCSCGHWVTPAFHMQKSKLDCPCPTRENDSSSTVAHNSQKVSSVNENDSDLVCSATDNERKVPSSNATEEVESRKELYHSAEEGL